MFRNFVKQGNKISKGGLKNLHEWMMLISYFILPFLFFCPFEIEKLFNENKEQFHTLRKIQLNRFIFRKVIILILGKITKLNIKPKQKQSNH
jgi:hypothetical protein